VEIGKLLMDRIHDVSHKFETVVDLGSLTGNNLALFQERQDVKTLFQVELSEGMLTRDVDLDVNYRLKPIRVVADEEFLPFADSSIDLVLSNLSLHWVNDLPSVFQQVRRCLRPDGAFIGALFGGDTLLELRSSFVLAEQERSGGISNHVSPLTTIGDVGDLLTSAGFAIPTIDLQTFNVDYADPWVLMNDLRSMGESNASIHRRKNMSRDVLSATAAVYKVMYGQEQGTVPATFDVIFFIGWAPHKSQPKPKPRGSQTHSLAEFAGGSGSDDTRGSDPLSGKL